MPDPVTPARLNGLTDFLLAWLGGEDMNHLAQSLQTCCVHCEVRKTCNVAFDLYNVGSTAMVDCLAAK